MMKCKGFWVLVQTALNIAVIFAFFGVCYAVEPATGEAFQKILDPELALQNANESEKENPQKSLNYAMRGLELMAIQKKKDPGLLSGLYIAIIKSYKNQNDFKTALSYAKKGIEISRESPNKEDYPEILRQTGVIYYSLNDYSQSLKYFLKVVEISEAEKLDKQMGMALSNSIAVYRRLNRYDEALKTAERAIAIFRKIKDKKGEAGVLINQAILYKDLGDYDKNLSSNIEALKICEEEGDQDKIARLQNNIGVLFMELKKFPDALEYFQKALKTYKKQNRRLKEMSSIYNNIGLVYASGDRPNPNLALENLFEGLKLSKEVGYSWGTANIMSAIGEVYIDKHEYSKALSNCSEALTIFIQIDAKVNVARTHWLIGKIHRLMKNYPDSEKHLKQSLELSQAIRASDNLKDCWLELSELYSTLKSDRAALECYKEHIKYKDILFSEESNRKINEMEAKYSTAQKVKEIEILKQDKEIQELVLKKQRYQKNFLAVTSIFVLILVLFVLSRYQLKKRATRKLEQEIDEHKRTSRMLSESERNFKTLAEKSQVGICIIQDGVLRYGNPSLTKIFGYSIEELNTDSLRSILTSVEQRLVNETQSELLNFEEKPSHRSEFSAHHKDGSIIYLEAHDSFILFDGKPAILSVLVDITERKKSEDELLKKRKLESIGILAGGIAHDFNNLLTIIIGHISLVKSSLTEDLALFQRLEKAENVSYRAADLAQKLITFSDGGWIIPKEIPFARLLQETFSYFPELGSKEYEIHIAPNLLPVYGDEQQLIQVLHHLLENACEASPPNETIQILAENDSIEPGNPLTLNPGKYVLISICDKGAGIPEESLLKIFDPYFSTKQTGSQQGGMGLGLAICYSIVKKHNGHISIESRINHGTTVHLYLPAESHLHASLSDK